MIVGLGHFELRLAGNASLKGKRSVVKSLLGRIRARFPVSGSEIDAQDRHDRAVLGIALVASSAKVCRATLDQVRDYVLSHADAQVLVARVWVERFDEPAEDFDPYA